jgi:DNA polymerase-1
VKSTPKNGRNSLDLWDEQDVVKHFGVRPDQMALYLALVGDSSDNIPGVPQIGPKTAAKLLAQYP